MRAADNRLPSLTGLRFVAAFGVFGFHITVLDLFGDANTASVLSRIFGQGSNGVSFFFILSGFVLTWAARPGATATSIWRRRAAKIFPNHLVTWVVGLTALAYTSHAVALTTTVPGFFLLQAWIPVPEVYFAANTPAWSLSCEAAFYAVFPLLLRGILRVRAERLWPLAGMLVIAIFAVAAAAQPLPQDLAYWFVYIFPVTRALEFTLGIVLAQIVREGRWIRLGLWPASGILVAVYAISAYIPSGYTNVARTLIPFALLIPAAATADLAGHRSPWRSRTFQWLGEISFAFYLVHQLSQRLIDKALGDHPRATISAVAITLLMLATSLLGAHLLHRIVERPLMRRLTRRPTDRAAAIPLPQPGLPSLERG